MLDFDVELNSRKIPNSVNVKDTGGVCAGLEAYTYIKTREFLFFLGYLECYYFLIFFSKTFFPQISLSFSGSLFFTVRPDYL